MADNKDKRDEAGSVAHADVQDIERPSGGVDASAREAAAEGPAGNGVSAVADGGQAAAPEPSATSLARYERPKVARSRARRAVSLAVFAALALGIVFCLGFGSLSSFGWQQIASLCPLGALEAMLAAKTVIPRGVVCIVLLVAVGAVLGKVFCSWACPVPSLRHIGQAIRRRTPSIKAGEAEHAGGTVPELKAVRPLSRRELKALKSGCTSCGTDAAACASHGRRKLDSRHIVLGGTLLSSAVFGFPVFCLVCPVGLTFATVMAFAQLFQIQVLTWGLLVFPLVLVLELTVLRKWCSKFCPLGAVMSLASIPNRLFRPKVDVKKCLRSHGVDCKVCATVCAEGLDPHSEDGMHECTKCRDCAKNCPAGAISFPLRRR